MLSLFLTIVGAQQIDKLNELTNTMALMNTGADSELLKYTWRENHSEWDYKSIEEIYLDQLEDMVSMTAGAILGLLSMLIGAVGIIWAASNAEVYTKRNQYDILDSLFQIQEQVEVANESIT